MDNSITVRDPDKLEYWTGIINECERRENRKESVIKWCLARNLDPRTYYYWHKKILKLYSSPKQVTNEIYEVNDYSCNTSLPAATIHSGSFSIDIYNGANTETISNICRMLGIC